MVFEGVLVDLLNRFLGSYVKNLDASQLKVGIFGGDVLLERLDLKENALDELNLPVRIFGGHLDKLRLKIPWSNLYGAPVVAEVDGLFVVAGPASAAKYDAERDAWEKKDNKDRQLKKIEDVRKKTLETKDKKDQAPGLVEKLVTQIIRNVQVTVRNIHVTFEDGVTDPSHPFSVGVTLDSLVVQSTDSNYVIGGQDVDPVSQLIYKLVHMSCLSLYWNTDTRLLLDGKLPSNWAETLKNRIARSHDTSSDMQFLLRPISAKAKLQLTMKPGVDEAIPQALVNVVLEHIAISLGKQQYCNIMSLVESFDRMSINQKYLKYKPLKGVSKDLRAWWRYAITAVLEEDVKRRTRMWSWKHIKKYRARCKRYRERYVEKLLAKKVSDKLQGELDELEANLDVLNIILCRQLAESKAERQLAAREKLKAKSGGGGLWGWTTSWVAGSPDQEPIITQPPTDVELAKEKEKLYEALGYSESGGKPSYSKEYVAHKVVVDLKKVSLQLYNPHGAVSELLADRVGVAFMQRPASGNISVTASLGSLTMNGRGQGGGEPPTIIQTNQRTAGSLLDVRFELKPLGKRADYSIMAKLKPVQIIYDADTIDDIIGMFLLPKDVQLQKLSAAASSRLEEVKTQGRAGLEHSIGQKKVMEMDISLHSPYLIIPENGALTKSSTVLLVDLGSLQVTSAPQQLDSVRHATREQLEAAFYDDFDIELRNVQVIVAGVSDDWKGARRDVSSPLHILTPTMLDLRVKNSLMDDAKLPKIKVSGTLPKLKLSLSDKKIKQVLKIFQSLPLPPPSLASKSETSKYSYDPSAHFSVNTEGLLSTMPTPLLPATTEGDGSDDEVWYTAEEGSFNESTGSYVCLAKKEDTSKKTVSANKLDLSFSIPEIKINFSEHDEQSQKDTSRLDLIVTSVSTSVQHRTWDTGVTASIGSLIVDDHYNMGVVREEPQHMLSTVSSEKTKKTAFLSVKYNKADSTGPQFQSLFASTQQSIDVSLSLLRLQLHRESLINLLAIAQDITNDIKSKAKTKDKLSSPSGTKLASKSQTKLDETTVAASKSVARVPGEKDLDLAATLTGIELILSDDNGNLLTSNIKGVETSVVIEEKAINISASLSDVCLVDADPGSRHPNVIVKMDKSEKVISTNVVVYKNAPKTDLNTANLSIKAKVQRLKVTILFRFLNKIKGFVSEFLTQLKLDQKTIDSAKEAAAKTATRTAEALREQSSSRVRLDITVFAPVLVLPLSALSQAAFIADLGRLKVKNNFLHADSIYEGTEDFDKGSLVSASGEKALLDKMEVSLSSIQLGRVERLKEETKPSPGHMIVEPLEFSGVVTRSLSSWCTVVPAVDVQANLQTLNLCFSPEDYHVTMSLLSSLNEGASTRPPPISPKEKDTQPEPEESLDLQPTKEVDVAEGGVNIRVTAVVGTVELALHTKGETVATVRVEELVTNVELLSNTIQVKVGISDVNVSSLNSDHLYPKIVSVTGSTKALEAKIGIYPQATKSLEGYLDTNQCDVSVEASVGQLRLVLLFLFVSKITNFLKELQVSQEAIDRAKKSAQESATAAINAVQEKQASGQRIKLSITLKAPEIVVPLHSNSGEVIVADLGVLRLSNSFHFVEGWSGGERPPLYEEYDIQLKNLQVYRTVVGVANDPPRSSILEPFNLSLAMKRNLSTSWYTDMPTIELDASLGNLKMSASDTDIEALCQVIIGNLKESSDYTPTTPIKNEAPADAVKGSLQPVPDDGATSVLSVKTDTKTSSTVFKMLVFKATLKSIEIKLFKSQRVSDKWAKGSHNSFVSLALDRFSSTVCIEGNGAMAATVEMLNACLDDSRSMPNKKVTRLIEKVVDDKGSTAPLFSVSLNKSPDGDISVDCTVESAKVLVDVVFIFLLLDYLKKSVSSLSKPAELSTAQEPLSPSIGSAHSLEDSIKSPTPESIVEATKRNSSDKSVGTLSVLVKITRPLIALLKDAEDKDSPALVLRSTVDFFMEQVPNGLSLKTEMSELAIFATRVSNLRNRATKVLEVKNLQPIKFAMQQSTSEGIAMDVEIPDVVLSFSPTTIRLILHVVKALPTTARNPEKIGDTVPLEAKPVDSSDLYPSHKVEAIEGKVTPVDQAMSLKRNVMVTKEKLSLVINSLLVLVEDTMVGGCPSPMVSIKMGNYTQCDAKAMQLTVVNWSTQLYVVSTVSMEVSYFNLGHNVWEPLLEPSVDPNYENQEVSLPWTIKATCSVSRNFSASVDRRYSHSSSVSSPTGSHGYLTSANIVTLQPSKQDKLPPEISIEIVSETPLVVTLTKSCLILLKDLWTLYGVEEPEVTGSETMEAAFVIKNKSSLHESTGCIDKDGEGSEKKTISATKLNLTFSIPEMRINFSEHNDQSHTFIPRIGLIVTSVFTSVQQRTWDMGVAASIASLTINDHYKRKGTSVNSQYLLNSVPRKETEKQTFLSVKYTKADSTGPQFQSLFASTQQSIDINLSLFRLQLHKESLTNLLATARDITDQIKSKARAKDELPPSSGAKLLTKSQTKIDETTAAVSKPLTGEKVLDFVAKFAEIELIVMDDNGQLLTSNIKGVETSVGIEKKTINISASVSDVSLMDMDPGSCHPNVIVKVDKSEKVFFTNVVVYKDAPKTDINTADFSIKAKVQKLKVTVLFRFLNRIKMFAGGFLTLPKNQKTMDTAKESSAKAYTGTAETLRQQNLSRVRLDITILAPVLVMPLSALSQAAFVADLGRLEVRNNFLYAACVLGRTKIIDRESFVSASEEMALLDKIEISLSSIQLGRFECLKKETKLSPGHTIMEPLNFKSVITRSLSRGCTAVPVVDIEAKVQALKLHFSPEDYYVTMSLLSSFNDGTSTGQPSISLKEKDMQPEESVDPQTTKKMGLTEGGVNIRVAAEVGAVELALHTKGETVATVRVEGVETSVVLEEKAINISASLSDVSLIDMDPGSCHPNVIVTMNKSEKVIFTDVVVYKNAPKNDHNTADISIKAEVQKLKVTVLFRFINRIKIFASKFMAHLKLDGKTLDSAKEPFSETFTGTAEALREQSSSRIRLDITVLAPVLVVPLCALSQAAFIADLGQLEVKNNFLYAAHAYKGIKDVDGELFVRASGEKAILDRIVISLSSIQVGRVESLKEVKPSSSRIVEPLDFKGVVTRSLSSWCVAVPAINIQARVKTLKLRFSPEDYHVTMSLLSSFNEGASTGPPSISLKETETQPKPEESVDPQPTKELGVTEGGVNIRVAAVVGAVELALHTKGETVATVRMEDLVTKVELLSNTIQVKIGISGVNVSDYSLNPNHLHSKILSMTGATKALEAKIDVYPQATKSLEGYLDTNQCDVSVEVSVGQLRLVLLFLFVSKITNFLKELQLSQEAIDRAKKSAPESATAAINTVQEQQTNGQRIKLSVTLKAPEIVVPLHSNSGEIILANLGMLRLSNAFHFVRGWSRGERPPLYEEYDVQLKDLQAYRTLLGVAYEPPQSLILKPFNLSLAMKRNLSISWYTDMPTIDLDASLGNLKMSASDTDIEALCQILTGNLKESLDYALTTSTKKEEELHAPLETEDIISAVFKMLVLKATLKSIEIELFKSQVDSDKWAKGSHNSFVSLALDRFSSTVCIESNGAMAVTGKIFNACLDNSRSMPNKKVARLIEKVMEDEGSNVPLVSVSFNKLSNGDRLVNCTVESVKVLVDVEYIFLLLDYWKKSVSSLSKSVEPSCVQKPPSSDATSCDSIDSKYGLEESIQSPTLGSTVEAAKRSSEDKPVGNLLVKVKIFRPLIALLKNSEHENSRALVLGSTVGFSMDQVANGLTLKAKISELTIFATRVSNLRNKATKVLEVKNSKPIKFGMQQSTSEETTIDVEIPDVVLSLSPTTIRLILHVVKALSVTKKASDVEIGETSPLDLWEMKPVDSSSWYLNPPVPKQESKYVEGTSVDKATSTPLREDFNVVNEKLTLVINSLLVLVEEENTMVGGSPFSIISIKMGNYTQSNAKAMELTATNWSTELYVLSTVSMEVSYFNLGHNVWEPLLEPSLDPSYENQEVYIPWTVKASVSKDLSASVVKGHSRLSSVFSQAGSHRSLNSASSVTTQPGKQDELPPEVSIQVVSETPLLVTLTKSCLMLFKNLWTAYSVEEQEVTEDVDSIAPEAMEAVFVIKNELGLNYPLTVNTKDTLKVHGAYSCTVRHGQSVPLHSMAEALQLKPGEYVPREVYKKRRVHIITIAIPSFKPIDVALGTSECVYYPLILADKSSSKKAKDSPQFGVVIDIQMSQRVPEVRIRSPLQVVNNLTEEVQVFWRNDLYESLPPTPLTILCGGSTHSLPLETTGSPAGGFHLKPISSGTSHSKDLISWTSKEKSFDLGCYSSRRSIQAIQKCNPFFMHVVINKERYSKQPSINIASRAHHTFVLNYPLVLQNLLPLSVTVTENTGSIVSKELPPGSKTNYSHVALSEEPRFHTKIDYNGRIWSGEVRLNKESNEYTQLILKPEYSVDKEGGKYKNEDEMSCLKLMIHVQEMDSWQLTLYCPYWIVNKTGLMLEYAGKSTDVVTVHHPQLSMALFPYKEVKVRVRGSSQQYSDWSKVFSLDAAGSEGIFQCLDKKSKQDYQMGTTVTTSSVGLSKVITISPLFMAFNQTRDEISFKVYEDLKTYTVKSKQLLVFWPKSNSEQMILSVNDQQMSNPSKTFKFTENASRLIQTNDPIPAVVTEIQVTGSANVVTFSPYYEGVVPVKIVNTMSYDVEFQQTAEYVQDTQTVPAGQSVFYSWRVPSAQKKAISWRIVYPAQRLKMKIIVIKDNGGKFKIPSKLLPHSELTTSLSLLPSDTQGSVSDWEESGESIDFQKWDEPVADEDDKSSGNLSGIEEDGEGEGENLTNFSLKQGLGIFGREFTSTTKKLFNRRSKIKRKSVGYWVSFFDGLQRVILFTTSHKVWSYVMGGQKTGRANAEVTLTLREVGLSLVNDERGLEIAYIGIRSSKPIWEIMKGWNRWKPVSNHLRKQLEKLFIQQAKEEKVLSVPESDYKIDFNAMMLVEKSGIKIRVRRSHFEGVSVQVTVSEHLTSIEAKINEIQIDNHLLFTSNPIILFAYPTPPTIASKYEPKPFIESSVILRNSAQSNVKQVKLFQVLVQEIGLNVDMNFILAIADLLANLPSGVTEVEGIERDVSMSKLPLEKSKVEQVSAAATRNYIKLLHLSPLAIHLSFYLDRDASYKPDEHKDSSSNSVFGAVLNAFTQFAFLVGRTKDAELQLGYFELEEVALTRSALISKIQKHYTQQAVLQLYSVVLGLEVLGNPVGFVKGLKDGTIGLFYHPIQGAVLGPEEFFEGLALGGRQFFSGTLGGLSGAVGKVSGAIGDFAAKLTGDDEFQEQRRRSADTWGQSLEGAAKGFVSGLTGVITQPYKGAKKEGAWGAIKGFSKGVVGVVLRPTAGLLDLTSATFNAVQKKSKAGDSTVAEIRAARYIGPERIVFPYSPRRSTGYALFAAIDNGRLLKTDTYIDHMELVDDPIKVLLITSRQLAVMTMCPIKGRFDEDYIVEFTEFTGLARIDEKRNTVVVMPVREESFAGLRFISGKKSYKEFDKTLTVLNEGIAKKSVELINQAYEEFRTAAAIDY